MFLMLIKNDSVQTDPVVFRNNKVYQVISVIPVLKSSQNSNKDDNNNDNNRFESHLVKQFSIAAHKNNVKYSEKNLGTFGTSLQ